MSSTHFDWSRIISEMKEETFGIPPDVVFQIVENDNLHEIKAHKMILAMVSPTFKTMFYSTDVGDKTSKVVKIEKTTAPAFQIMKDAIYNTKSIEDSLEGKSVDEVFHVVDLIERFHIPELMEAVKKVLANFPITDDTVLEVAEEAMEYTHLFEAESQHLLVTCAQFLMPKLHDAKSTRRYAKENKDRKEVFATLLGLMDDIEPTECPNCKKEACQDGMAVRDDEFREGLILTNNKASGAWGNRDYGTVQVTKVGDTAITVTSIKAGVTLLRLEGKCRHSNKQTQNGLIGDQFNNASRVKKLANEPPLWLFSCK